jgi:hypothetical protein
MFASLEIATTNKQSNNQFPLKFEEIGHDITNYKATAVSREGIYIATTSSSRALPYC